MVIHILIRPNKPKVLCQGEKNSPLITCGILYKLKFGSVSSRTHRTGNAFERLVLFTGFTQFAFVFRKPPFCDVAEYGEADQA